MASLLPDISAGTPTQGSGFGVKYGIPMALQLGLIGLSAGQSIAARNRIRSMKLPSLPQITRNPLLAGRIGQAQREAEFGTDALRREREVSTALATEQARQVGSQLGGAQYAAMMQNQAIANDQSRRQGLLQDEALRMQRQGQLDQLIGMDMQQDARADQFALQDFQNRFNFANQMRMMEEANLRQANSNIAATGGALAADMPTYADAFMKARALRKANTLTAEPRMSAYVGGGTQKAAPIPTGVPTPNVPEFRPTLNYLPTQLQHMPQWRRLSPLRP